MMLNFSNHPSSQWGEKQIKEANLIFGEIQDMSFPQIDPCFDEVALDKIVKEYFNEILLLKPEAVHIMGEMTFTFRLVKMLQKENIKCYASTTERIVKINSDLSKTVHFNFIQFRLYALWIFPLYFLLP